MEFIDALGHVQLKLVDNGDFTIFTFLSVKETSHPLLHPENKRYKATPPQIILQGFKKMYVVRPLN